MLYKTHIHFNKYNQKVVFDLIMIGNHIIIINIPYLEIFKNFMSNETKFISSAI